MKVSVIIPTKDRVDDLRECLDTITAQTIPPDEVIIIDNSTNDETEQYITSWQDPGFKCIYIRQIKGGAASLRNLGVDNSSGDIVIFLDDDTELDRRYIEEMLKIFVNHTKKEIGAVTGVGGCDIKDMGTLGFTDPKWLKDIPEEGDDFGKRMRELIVKRYGEGIFEKNPCRYLGWKIAKWARDSAKALFILGSWRKEGKILASGFPSDYPKIPQSISFAPVERVQGGNMALRREVLETFKFDETLELSSPYAFSVDIEFGLRVAKGYKVVATSRPKLIHKRSPSGRLDLKMHFMSMIVNHHYIVKKNMNHPVNIAAFWWAVLGILISRMVLLIFRPSRDNWLMLAGVIEGIRIVHKKGR